MSIFFEHHIDIEDFFDTISFKSITNAMVHRILHPYILKSLVSWPGLLTTGLAYSIEDKYFRLILA